MMAELEIMLPSAGGIERRYVIIFLRVALSCGLVSFKNLYVSFRFFLFDSGTKFLITGANEKI